MTTSTVVETVTLQQRHITQHQAPDSWNSTPPLAIELNDANSYSATEAAASTVNVGIGEELVTGTISYKLAAKLASAGFSFFLAGVNDGSLGTLIPYFRNAYGKSLGSVTIIYGMTFAGWCLAGATNGILLSYVDMGTVLALGAVLQLLAHCLRFWTPPFGLYCVTFFIAALGIAFQDSHSNSFVSSVKGAHRWLGFIHAMYALGLLTSPFIANSIAAYHVPSRWNLFYLAPLGFGVVNLVLVLYAFRDSLRKTERPVAQTESIQGSRRVKNSMQESWEIMRLPGVWQLSLFFFFYLGASFCASGWLVEYLVLVRHGDVTKMGYVPAALSGGLFLGRLLLPEPTHRLGERRMVFLYLVLWLGLQLVFWLVPSITADIITIAFSGFFSGPLFATAISVGSKTFPKRSSAAALGFVFMASQAGAALFPTLTGLLASHKGVGVLQPVVVALIVATMGSWALVPSKPSAES